MRNLRIISAAIMTVLLVGTGMAQGLNYKWYGQAHVSTDMQSDGDESGLFVASNTTRFGVKGSYATDYEAFTVVFQYENNADFNGESVGLSTRNSFAGLQGDWGRLIWGRHDTPLYTLGRSVDFFDSRVGDLRNVTQYFGYGWDNRMRSMIMYSSPLLGESFKLHAQFVPDEGADDSMFFSAAGMYDKEGLMIGVGFETHGNAWEAFTEDSSAFRVAASYQADALKVAGLFQSVSNVAGVEDVSATTMGLGLSYMLDDAFEPKIQVYMMDPNTDVDDDGAMMLAVGVDYHLNKQARLYLAYAMMMNEDDARYVPFRGGHGKNIGYGPGLDSGESPYGLSVGLIACW